MTSGAGDGVAGASISPDDPTKVVLASGAVVPLWFPIVELTAVDGHPYARLRKPGASRDELRAVGDSGRRPWPWRALVKPTTTIAVTDRTLRTSTFVHTFPGPILDVIELEDGAYAVAWLRDAVGGAGATRSRACGITTVEASGAERWALDCGYLYELQRVDDPAISDALVVHGDTFGALLHPWDGRALFTWDER